MPTKEDRAERRDRQAAEIEESQNKLRASIAVTERLVGESDEMLRRHRQECDEGDRGGNDNYSQPENGRAPDQLDPETSSG
jgi:hypothetical protein